MDKLSNEINQITDHYKQQKIVQFNTEQLQTIQELTNTYDKLNNELSELNQKLMQ